MAKLPKNPADEEEIIRLPDNSAEVSSDEPLSSEMRRALAEARLRALAFGLGAEQAVRDEEAQFPSVARDLRTGQSARREVELDDVELLGYLLNQLPVHRRVELEGLLRGDEQAFGRLMTLYSAFQSPTDGRDRRRADDPARKIRRHRLGRVDISSAGDVLKFKAEQVLPRGTQQFWTTYDRPPHLRALFDPDRSIESVAAKKTIRGLPRLRWSPAAAAMLGAALKVAMSQFHSDMNFTQNLLARWEAINRPGETERRGTDISGGGNVEQVSEQLLYSLRTLERIADHITEELGSVASRMGEDLRLDAEVARSQQDVYEDVRAEHYFAEEAPGLALTFDSGSWMDDVDIRAGPWVLHLTGSARPTPQLAITLRKNDEATSPAEPFLTLVRPAQDFETVNLDPSRGGSVALPRGESIMLVQDDEVWEIPLSF
jgi:hypothetical protein